MTNSIVTWSIFTVYCITALLFGTIIGWADKNPFISAALKEKFGLRTDDPFKDRSQLYILFLGCDELRDERDRVVSTSGRSDSIQLMRLDFKNGAIGMMQIPRDTIVELPGYRTMRINALHSLEGAGLTLRAVEQLTGIHADRTVTLTYEGIKKMVDEVGGVPIFVNKRMKYQDRTDKLVIDFQVGQYHMNGKDAIGFLRYRNDSDFERGKRQQDFLVAFMQRLMSQPGKIDSLSLLLIELLKDGLTSDEVARLALFSRTVASSKIKQGLLPVTEGKHYNLYLVEAELPAALIKCGLVDEPKISRNSSVSAR